LRGEKHLKSFWNGRRRDEYGFQSRRVEARSTLSGEKRDTFRLLASGGSCKKGRKHIEEKPAAAEDRAEGIRVEARKEVGRSGASLFLGNGQVGVRQTPAEWGWREAMVSVG